MLVNEDGPNDIFKRLRVKAKPLTFISFACFYCLSVVVAFPLSLLGTHALWYWLPISALAIFINAIHEKVTE